MDDRARKPRVEELGRRGEAEGRAETGRIMRSIEVAAGSIPARRLAIVRGAGVVVQKAADRVRLADVWDLRVVKAKSGAVAFPFRRATETLAPSPRDE